MTSFRALFGFFAMVLGLAILCIGMWFFYEELKDDASVLAQIAFYMITTALPIYGLGCKLIGEAHGRKLALEEQAKNAERWKID